MAETWTRAEEVGSISSVAHQRATPIDHPNAPPSWAPQTRKRLFPGPYPRYRIYRHVGSYIGLIRDIVTGRMTRGDDVRDFESALGRFLGSPNVVCTCMARVGVHVAIKSLIKPGQEVVMSPYTIADIVNMVVSAGGRPVFADIERASCNIDPDEVRRLIGANTGAVLITHLHGVAARAIEIRDVCRKKGVPLIEDAAQAFGGRVAGSRVGTIGDVGVFSFGMYKNLSSWYGGAVVTADSALALRIRTEVESFPWQDTRFILNRMSQGLATDLATAPWLFRSLVFWVFRYGALHDVSAINRYVNTELDLERHDEIPRHYRSRMTPAQARIALPQLDWIDADAQARIRNAEVYRRGLSGIPGLVLPPESDGASHVYAYFPIQVEDRRDFLKWMMRHNRDVAAQHLKNCADLPSFAEFARDCPNARATAASTVILPTYPRYPLDQIERNVEIIRAYFGL